MKNHINAMKNRDLVKRRYYERPSVDFHQFTVESSFLVIPGSTPSPESLQTFDLESDLEFIF